MDEIPKTSSTYFLVQFGLNIKFISNLDQVHQLWKRSTPKRLSSADFAPCYYQQIEPHNFKSKECFCCVLGSGRTCARPWTHSWMAWPFVHFPSRRSGGCANNVRGCSCRLIYGDKLSNSVQADFYSSMHLDMRPKTSWLRMTAAVWRAKKSTREKTRRKKVWQKTNFKTLNTHTHIYILCYMIYVSL